jgi:2-methylcitrate synthase
MTIEAPVASAPKAKKSVALSGVAAGNTALCTVGRTGNDLHYRGYDILDIADVCEFEEIAYLLVHGKLPNIAELAGYKAKLKAMRGLPAPVKAALEALPGAAHPMDVMRTGLVRRRCGRHHPSRGARYRGPPDGCLRPMLLYRVTEPPTAAYRRRDRRRLIAPCTRRAGSRPPAGMSSTRHAETSIFLRRGSPGTGLISPSAIAIVARTGVYAALTLRPHVQNRYVTPRPGRKASRRSRHHRLRHPVYTIADPQQGHHGAECRLSVGATKMFDIASA